MYVCTRNWGSAARKTTVRGAGFYTDPFASILSTYSARTTAAQPIHIPTATKYLLFVPPPKTKPQNAVFCLPGNLGPAARKTTIRGADFFANPLASIWNTNSARTTNAQLILHAPLYIHCTAQTQTCVRELSLPRNCGSAARKTTVRGAGLFANPFASIWNTNSARTTAAQLIFHAPLLYGRNSECHTLKVTHYIISVLYIHANTQSSCFIRHIASLCCVTSTHKKKIHKLLHRVLAPSGARCAQRNPGNPEGEN